MGLWYRNTKIIAGPILFVLLWAGTVLAADRYLRTQLKVDNLSCVSCLATIQAEMEQTEGALGMSAALKQGNVTIDHSATLDPAEIAAAVTRLGYPAAVTVSDEIDMAEAIRFSRNGGGNSGAGCGGCSSEGPGADPGNVIWRSVAQGTDVAMTMLRVNNLTCTSCLSTIEEGLRSLNGTIGMKSNIRTGRVTVIHQPQVTETDLVALTTGLGYPANVADLATAKTGRAINISRPETPATRFQAGSFCPGARNVARKPCSAAASAWQELYRRFFNSTDGGK